MAVFGNQLPSTLVIILLAWVGQAACDSSNQLSPDFYFHSCPAALGIVRSVVENAVQKEARMAASLLRLHFHDCFVHGCDGSVLTSNLSWRKPVQELCHVLTSSPLQLATLLPWQSGGPWWNARFGRRDSRMASLNRANKDIPAPNSTLQALITKFKRQGLNQLDLVALSGSHTIGMSRCTSFRQRLYRQNGNGKSQNIDGSYLTQLKPSCPQSGGDGNVSPLDPVSPAKFDNGYFKNLQS